jgi:hypothetical protein
VIELVSDPLLTLSILCLPRSALVLLDPSSILDLCPLGGGGGGGSIEACLGAEEVVGGSDDNSILDTLGGRPPDIVLEEPRAGGTGGKDVVEGDVSAAS